MKQIKELKSMKAINKNKEQKIVQYIQELYWFLESHKDISIKDINDYVQTKSNDDSVINGHQRLHSDTRFLVGVLPQLFQDTELFSKKEDIIDFANQILGIKLNLLAKRSKIEYIGSIVCQVSNSDNKNLESVVQALEVLMNNEKKLNEVRKNKKTEPNFSWNDAISKLNDQ